MWNKLKNKGEDAALDENRKLQKSTEQDGGRIKQKGKITS